MDRFVANLNIVHFRKQLAEETDEAKRLTLLALLAEEEAKLAGLPTAPKRSDVRSAEPTAASEWVALRSVPWFPPWSIRRARGGMGTREHVDRRHR